MSACKKSVTLISVYHGVDKSTQVYSGSAVEVSNQDLSSASVSVSQSDDCVSCHPDRSLPSARELPDQEFSDAELSCFHQPGDASMTESLDLTLCHLSPELTIEESKLSPTVVSRPAFYYEENDIPGVCIDRGDNSFSWSRVKFSRRAVKIGAGSTESSELDSDDCLSIDYQPRNRVPGFEVDTKSDSFWSPIAHRTRSKKSKHKLN